MENQPFVVRNHWFSSTYLGLLLRLEKGDIILVTLHQANWLHDVKILFFWGGRHPLAPLGIYPLAKMAMPGKYYHFFVDKIPSERTKPPWLRREFPSAMRTLEAMHPVSSNTFHWREFFFESWLKWML